jgi:hypothetical protein
MFLARRDFFIEPMTTSFQGQVQTLRLLRWPLVGAFLFCLGAVLDLPGSLSFGRDTAVTQRTEPTAPAASVALAPKPSEGGEASATTKTSDDRPGPTKTAPTTSDAPPVLPTPVKLNPEPKTASTSGASGAPAKIDPPAVDPPALDPPALDPPALDPPGLTIVNAAKHAIEVGFLVDNESIKLAPGQSRHFEGVQERRIEFHRGGDFGVAEMRLSQGEHRFTISSKGWQLRPAAPQNAASP